MSDVSIADHAFLSDCGCAALVNAVGSVDWWSTSSFDSPSVFGRLLGKNAGHFQIRPSDPVAAATWSYRQGSLVLDTVWTTGSGTVRVTDALALAEDERGHDLGRDAPGVLMRAVHCTAGQMDVDIEFAPRPEYGLVYPRIMRRRGQLVADGGDCTVVLHTDLDFDVDGSTAHASVSLREGEVLAFAVTSSDPWAALVEVWSREQVCSRITETHRAWLSWSELHQAYEGPLRDLVWHSGVVLRGLTFARSGAIAAAATTSLPEGIGSGRTWDYRYTWVRDASMTLQGLFVAACPDEASEFFSFLARVVGTQLDQRREMQIMFGVRGNLDLTERTLGHLEGWRGSGPVRIGNAAWQQRQLDVYGALLDAAYLLRGQLRNLDADCRRLLVSAADTVCMTWCEDDQGIWEMRGPARPFLHSKLMCWLALDKALALADLLQVTEEKSRHWAGTRKEIRTAIETRGWNETVGAYTQAFGSDDLDASALLVAIAGFHEPDDPRLLRTIDAIEAALSDDRGLLFRYVDEDGLGTNEGTFLLCTLWLAHALAVTDQPERADAVLMRAASYATSLGLLAEQVDPKTGELLGNFPQAFSHLGLVNAAQALMESRTRTE